jgi:Family of unknown function (DUF7009)
MKVRLKDNTVRFRLTKTEVKDFATKGVVEAHTQFGTALESKLTYTLVKADCAALQASFNQNKIIIKVPENLATVWVNTELIGLDNHGKTNNGSDLKILIEKDFACLKERVGEDERDMFPHPEEDTHNC